MREEKLCVDDVEIYLDAGVRQWKGEDFPYCRIRGRKITEEQAFELIRRCDHIFSKEDGLSNHPDCLKLISFDMRWFDDDRFGWVNPNGTVGGNISMRRDDVRIKRMATPRWQLTELAPLNTEQLAEECAVYAKNFPFLDAVTAITGWNEKCPEREKREKELEAAYENNQISYGEREVEIDKLNLIDFEREGFEEAVRIGVWIHGGVVEIMGADRTREKYLEYERLYEESDRRIYLPDYYKLFQPDVVTRDYLCRCIAAYGITDPDTFIRQKINRYTASGLKYLPRGVKNGVFMREEIIYADGVKVILDSGTRDWDPLARRPYYRLRGKRITEEQAFEVIRRCDNFFTWILNFDSKNYDCIYSMNFDMWWYMSNHFPDKYGWVHPNGIVGTNGITQKFPRTDELIKEWTVYAREFPFLDLAVVITWWDEQCSERHNAFYENFNDSCPESGEGISEEEYYRRMREINFTDYERDDSCREFPKETFERSIEIGVWLHDGIVEIMNPDRAYEKYLEYERLYEEPDPRIYMPEYYSTFKPDIVTRESLYKCLKVYGIDDPEKFLRERTQPYQTQNLK